MCIYIQSLTDKQLSTATFTLLQVFVLDLFPVGEHHFEFQAEEGENLWRSAVLLNRISRGLFSYDFARKDFQRTTKD